MERKDFLKQALGLSFLVSMDGLSHLLNGSMENHNTVPPSQEMATFGAVHLNNTSLAKSKDFWTKIMGLKIRKEVQGQVEFGTETQTLVVVHQAASTPFAEGYSGLYHFAIHATDKHEFARMLHRLQVQGYPFAPTDHTMTQSLYLEDPDGITVELALETPERFRRVISTRGLSMEGTDGVIRAGSAPLDLGMVLSHLQDRDLSKPIHADSKVGHIHLYATQVDQSNAFYRSMGFQQFNHFPQYMYADLGAGGVYQHRVAMNSWHGQNRPLAPSGSAGLRHYHIRFASEEKLMQALKTLSRHEQREDGFWTTDPTGNVILLTHH